MTPARPRILLTGATGQVGWELRRALAPLGEVAAPPRPGFDLADADGLRRAVRDLAPALVVNSAAWTDVDGAEAEPDAARAANAVAPGVVAEEAARLGAPLIQLSTDYVFDGAAERPYREDDGTAPLSVYGRTKLDGERAVAAAGGPHLVLRTGWVYGLRGRNFLRTVLRLAREREELRIVDDQVGSPTWSRMLAGAIASIVATMRDDRRFRLARSGTYHLAAAGSVSRHDFAAEVLALDPRREEQRCRRLVAVPTAEFPTPAARPAFSALDCARAERALGVRLPHWREQLRLCLEP